MTNAQLQERARDIVVKPTTPHVGAEITGLDLSQELSAPTLATIVDALHEWGVVFFRAQALTETQQVTFSRQFGELERHVLKQYTNPEFPEILILSNILKEGSPVGLADAGHHWHSDTSYRHEPDRGSILYAREVPTPNAHGETAGDTLFASAQAAYDFLEPSMKSRLQGLEAVNSYISYYDSKIREGSKREPLTHEQKRRVPDTVHPLIRTHPFTGRKSIYVNPGHTLRIVGVPEDEGRELLSDLYDRVTKPELIYRHKWRVGDVLVWDNCVVQHNAIGDYKLPQRRLMHRTTVRGTVPF